MDLHANAVLTVCSVSVSVIWCARSDDTSRAVRCCADSVEVGGADARVAATARAVHALAQRTPEALEHAILRARQDLREARHRGSSCPSTARVLRAWTCAIADLEARSSLERARPVSHRLQEARTGRRARHRVTAIAHDEPEERCNTCCPIDDHAPWLPSIHPDETPTPRFGRLSASNPTASGSNVSSPTMALLQATAAHERRQEDPSYRPQTNARPNASSHPPRPGSHLRHESTPCPPRLLQRFRPHPCTPPQPQQPPWTT